MQKTLVWPATLALAAMVCAGTAAAQDGTAEPTLPTPTVTAPVHPDLSGTWVLNPRASDDPAQMMRRAREAGDGGRGGRGGGRGGPGSARSNALDRGVGALDDDMRRAPRDGEGPGDRDQTMQRRIGRLDIFQAGPEFDVTNGLDITRVLHTDGRSETVWTERGEQQATASWQDQTLVVQWSGRQGPGRTTRYSLSPDNRQLVVLEQVVQPGTQETVTLRLVYDRARPDAAAPADAR